jgi:hypothetical protein
VDEPRSETSDRLAIMDAIYRYCRAMDRIDIPLGYSIWHDDGEADYGEGIFRGSGRGFIDFVAERHATMLAHSHQVTTVIIDLAGDLATSESYVTATLRFVRDERLMDMTSRGRYLDRWSFRDERWAIDRRVYLHDLDDLREAHPSGIPSRSARDTSDLSYAILPLR